ncbi:hypothetical protein WJX79_002202 [Trebouxia sp. C0005]
MAAETMTTEAMAFMVEYTSGVICVPLEGRDLDRLQIPLMVSSAENEEMLYTAFTVTVDARHGTTTGISAADRTATVKALADRTSQPGDFKKPGHIFPLRYRHGGVLKRPGHTEAAVDLARLANCAPVGVLCEIVSKADGSMARTPELLDFAKQHNLNQAEGVLIYLQSQGKAPALSEQLSQLESPSDQDGSTNDPLHHGIVACILRDLGVKSMRVLSETDSLSNSMNGSGLSVSESVSLESLGNGSNGNGGQSSSSSSDVPHQESVEAQLDQWMPRT